MVVIPKRPGFVEMTSRSEKKARQSKVKAAMDVRAATGRPAFETRLGTDSWEAVLGELDRLILNRLRSGDSKLRRYGAAYPAAIAVLEKGTMLREPASADELKGLEAKFEIRLPASYRGFLEASNGLSLPMDGQFVAAHSVLLYKTADPIGAALMEELEDGFEGDFQEPTDAEYFDYSDPQRTCLIRPRYIRTALALNGPDGENLDVGKGIGWALLVRDLRFDDGEYEIWQQAFEHHCRFPSFAAYFSCIRRSIVGSLDWL